MTARSGDPLISSLQCRQHLVLEVAGVLWMLIGFTCHSSLE
jgi:hypothetical protein